MDPVVITLSPTRTVDVDLVGPNGTLTIEDAPQNVGLLLSPVFRGPPGIKGDPGDPGPGAGPIQTLQGVAGPSLGGHRVVGLDDTGVFRYVGNDVALDVLRVAGITTGAASSGAAVSVQTAGPLTEPSWSWTPDLPIFVGLNGLPTQTPPTKTGGAVFSMVLGVALTATTIFIRINTPLYL